MSNDFLYIDGDSQLRAFCAELTDRTWVGVDTEFIRDKSYYPRLCLLQLATDEHIACIDPLAVEDLTPLLDVLYDSRVTKVMHAARQDLEIFYHLKGSVPAPVFDTQIAGALLSHSDQAGYGALVADVLGVQLEKGCARTDWGHRPLSPEQVRYAADDVRYLGALYRAQYDSLQQFNRLTWLEEDFSALVDPQNYSVTPQQAWRRVKDVRRLKGVQRAVLQALAEWREHRAMTLDRPRKWILRDDTLVELARQMPRTKADLRKVRGLESQVVEKQGEQLVAAINRGRQQPKQLWPQLEPKPELTMEQESLIDAMMATVRLRANEHGLSPVMLATRKQLERLVTHDYSVPVNHGWRRRMVGEDLLAMLEGEVRLCIEQGVVRLER